MGNKCWAANSSGKNVLEVQTIFVYAHLAFQKVRKALT